MRRGAWDCLRTDKAWGRTWLAVALGLTLLGTLVPARAAIQLREALFVLDRGGGTYGPVGPVRGEVAATLTVALPHMLPRDLLPQGGAQQIDTAWYRLKVPAEMQGPLRLYLPRWQTVGQVAVYADTKLLYRSQSGAVWNGFNHPLWITLDQGDGAPSAVWLRVDHERGAGLGISTAWLGTEAKLGASRWWREWLQSGLPFLASAGFLAIGIFALGVWVRRREPVYALFAAASFLFYLRTLHYHLGLEPLPIPEPWFGWITMSSLAWLIPTVYFLGLRLDGRRYPWVEWILIVPIAAATVVGLPPLAVLPNASAAFPIMYLLLLAALVAITILGAWSAWHSRSRDALMVALLNALSIPLAAHDWLLASFLIDIEQIYLLPYASIALLALFLQILLRRYLDALSDSENAKALLELRLSEREAQLVASHARLREIEREQVLAHERQRLMQDMHDGLGSSLMGALKVVERGQQQDLAQVLRECIDDLKLAIDSLEPAQADLLLLLATLRFRLGTRLEQAGIALQWQVADIPPISWLDARSALHILRILQEVLSNAVKHSGAHGVVVRTSLDDGQVVVTIEDDGGGFDIGATDGRGRGIVHIRQRAEAIGAAVRWVRQAVGMRFELALPMR